MSDVERVEIELRVTQGGKTSVLRGVGEKPSWDTEVDTFQSTGPHLEVRTVATCIERVAFSWRPVPDPETGAIYTIEEQQ